jgi:hypothetical protein
VEAKDGGQGGKCRYPPCRTVLELKAGILLSHTPPNNYYKFFFFLATFSFTKWHKALVQSVLLSLLDSLFPKFASSCPGSLPHTLVFIKIFRKPSFYLTALLTTWKWIKLVPFCPACWTHKSPRNSGENTFPLGHYRICHLQHSAYSITVEWINITELIFVWATGEEKHS